jgi:hypothetical protein
MYNMKTFILLILASLAVANIVCAGGSIQMRPYLWEGPYSQHREKYATKHDTGLCIDLRAPWFPKGERLILRTSEIVGFDTGYFYDDHFPTQEQNGRGKGYRHIPFQFDWSKAPRVVSADCVVPGKGEFRLKLAARSDYVDLTLSIRNGSERTMSYVDWYFCPTAFEASSIGNPTLDRTFLFDGERLWSLAELGAVGKGYEVMFPTSGNARQIPPLHAANPFGDLEAALPLVMIQDVSGKHTVALGFKKSHSIFCSAGNGCFHADPIFVPDLKPGEERTVKGRLYLVTGTPSEVMQRFRADFGL